jgi:uncharacterized protein YggE
MKTALPLLLMLAPIAAAQANDPNEARITGTRLDISATGESHRTPDVATVSAGVVTQAGNAVKAMADNAARMTATIAALRRAGVEERDIRTQAIRLNPQYRYADGQPPALTGYQATNSVAVTLRDLPQAGAVLDALVAAGANEINGPNLAVAHPEAALDEARTDALAKARARAELYAKAAGLHVSRIVAISENGSGEPVVRPMQIMVTAKRAATPIAAGDETMGVTLNVTFELH